MERRAVELRQDGGRIVGTLIRYGDIARLPGFRERFESGAFGSLEESDVIANIGHSRARPVARTGGGGLTLADSPTELRAVIEPIGRDGADALELVTRRVLRGLSIEFDATRERFEDDLRIVEAARLGGIGIVDNPAYVGSGASVRAAGDVGSEVRQTGRGISGRIPYEILRTVADRGDVRKEYFPAKAFKYALEAPEREITVTVGRSFERPIASKLTGGVKFRDTAAALIFDVAELPDTSWVRDLRGMLAADLPVKAAPRFRVPPADVVPNAVEQLPESELGGKGSALVNVYRSVVLTGIALVVRGAMDEAEVEPTEEQAARFRRRLFL